MDTTIDIKLVKRAVDGESAAFESLVNRHYTLVYRVAYKWCGVRENAEDITQEVFVKLGRQIKGYRGKADFKTWLYRITVNTSKDFFRKNSRRRANEAAYMLEREVSRQGGETDDNPVKSEELYSALSGLSSKLKEAVILVLAEGLSHKEAAAVLGCAETTVSWRVFKARKKLTKILTQEV